MQSSADALINDQHRQQLIDEGINSIVWARFKSLTEGSRIESKEFW